MELNLHEIVFELMPAIAAIYELGFIPRINLELLPAKLKLARQNILLKTP
jgi:hypothetical protein